MGLVELGRYPDATLAHIVRGRLETAGIEAFCFDGGINLVEGAQLMFPVRVMVPSDSLAEARSLLKDELAPPAERELQPSAAWLRRRRRILIVVAAMVAALLIEYILQAYT